MRTSTLPVFLAAFLAVGLPVVGAHADDLRVVVGPSPPASGVLEGMARLEIPQGQDVGGLSALLWLADGVLLLASDRGALFQTRLRRGAAGAVVGLDDWRTLALPLPSGWSRDVEGLAVSQGNLLISVEEPPHVIRFAGDVRAPERVASYLTWEDLGFARNRGIEALTDLPGDGWLAVAETRDAQGFAGLTRDERRFVYRAPEGFRPTGADRDGERLFFIERRLTLLGGWQARITCLPLAALDEGEILEPTELALLDAGDAIDNLEGIAVRRRAGDLDLLVVSDDNEMVLQRTLLLHYRWKGGASGGCEARPHEPAERQQQDERHADLDG